MSGKPGKRTEFQRVRNAIERELEKMQQDAGPNAGYIGDQWTGKALASWITPGIIRAVRFTLSPPKPCKGKRRPCN